MTIVKIGIKVMGTLTLKAFRRKAPSLLDQKLVEEKRRSTFMFSDLMVVHLIPRMLLSVFMMKMFQKLRHNRESEQMAERTEAIESTT